MTAENRTVTWGILGTARIAVKRLIPAFRESQIAQLTAVASRDKDRAQRFADEQRIPKGYGSYEALLADDRIDAVYVPLPNHLHREWALHAMAAGKHVLCEKPLATSAAEGVSMFDEAERRGVRLMEGFMYRFHPQTKRVRQLMDQGVVGPPRLIRAAHSFALHLRPSERDFRWREDAGGGSLSDLGIYCIDTARLLFGAEPIHAIAASRYHPDHTAEAETQAILAFPGDRTAVFDSSFLLASRKSYEVIGERGRLTAREPYNPGHGVGVELEVATEEGRRIEPIAAQNEYRLEVDHLSECILEGRAPAISREDSLGNLRVIDALRESARTNRWVEIPSD
jgi:D-xylose 1-dehydrogenase (NADP+, D-xylono-1,5-lactone-forming)